MSIYLGLIRQPRTRPRCVRQIIEKAVNVEAKAAIQPPSKTKKIDSRYPKSYRLSAKKDKDENNHWNIDKAKSYTLSPANIS